jgi:hypothetical protein
MKRLIGILVPICLLAAGCTTVSVDHDWDQDADFTTYKTFAWLPKPKIAPGDRTPAMHLGDMLDQRVRAATTVELTARGLQEDTDNPDLWLIHYSGSNANINVMDQGYSYGGPYWGVDSKQIDIFRYSEGTLIIDLVDVRTKELVFRGTATSTIESNPKSEQIEKDVNEAVSKIFMNYPPRADS